MLQAVSRATNHSRQRTVTIISSHGKAEFIQEAMEQISAFFRKLTSTARQLNAKERWRLILSRALSIFSVKHTMNSQRCLNQTERMCGLSFHI